MLCLNYLNKTVELLFILYNFAIVPSVGTGIKSRAITERWIWRIKGVWLPLGASPK